LRKAIDALAQKPALALTPEMIAQQIEAAGQGAYRDANQALAAAQGSLQSSIAALSRVTASVRAAQRQNQMLAGATGLALILGWVGGCIIPPAIDWVVPEAWQWPEKRAMSALHRNGWNAGERLMSVTNPGRWSNLQAAVRLSEKNNEAINKCAQRASERGLRSVGCNIEVGKTEG